MGGDTGAVPAQSRDVSLLFRPFRAEIAVFTGYSRGVSERSSGEIRGMYPLEGHLLRMLEISGPDFVMVSVCSTNLKSTQL